MTTITMVFQHPVTELDSRFRGNDRRFEMDPIPNDATASNKFALTERDRKNIKAGWQ
jgi:hypothetical protein